ncbi:glycerol acyltransferase, partial [Streptomyces sp. SID4940]
MADAKVLPFDDDRSRSGAGRRRVVQPGAAGAAPVSALPGAQVPES